MKLCIVTAVILFMASCTSKEGSLSYHAPEFAPMYPPRCYAENKNWLCMDKEKEEIKYIPESFIYFLFMSEMR